MQYLAREQAAKYHCWCRLLLKGRNSESFVKKRKIYSAAQINVQGREQERKQAFIFLCFFTACLCDCSVS